MKTKNLLLIGGGLLAVYFLTRKKNTTTTTTNTMQPLPESLTNTGRPIRQPEITLTKSIEEAPLLPVYNNDTLDTIDFVEGIV